MSAGSRLLVTGFEPFPGAPVNPTEWLVGALSADPPGRSDIAAFRAEVLPVDYAAIGPRLSAIGREFAPDIAIHFGLAAECRGFRLERVARNRFAGAPVDNAGTAAPDGPICAGPAELASRLPLQAIHDALQAHSLPVEWSDDAGSYLCNMVMTLSLAGVLPGFTPAASGFVHVPPAGEGRIVSRDALLVGARLIIATCLTERAGATRHLP
jgi:pyroglutamyl-peptidase